MYALKRISDVDLISGMWKGMNNGKSLKCGCDERVATRISVAWFEWWVKHQCCKSHQRKWLRPVILFIHLYGLSVKVVKEQKRKSVPKRLKIEISIEDHSFSRWSQLMWQQFYIKELWKPLILTSGLCALLYCILSMTCDYCIYCTALYVFYALSAFISDRTLQVWRKSH